MRKRIFWATILLIGILCFTTNASATLMSFDSGNWNRNGVSTTPTTSWQDYRTINDYYVEGNMRLDLVNTAGTFITDTIYQRVSSYNSFHIHNRIPTMVWSMTDDSYFNFDSLHINTLSGDYNNTTWQYRLVGSDGDVYDLGLGSTSSTTLTFSDTFNNISWLAMEKGRYVNGTWEYITTTNDPYDYGHRCFEFDNLNYTAIDPVPEPATMLLLGAGLVGLAGFRRRFRKS